MLVYRFNNFYEFIEKNAQEQPNKTVIFAENKKLSAKELLLRVDKFARFLELSLKFGDKAALIVSNSPEFVVAFLAITKIGAVATPINTFLKKEEFEYILDDSKAKILIASPQFSEQIDSLLDSTGLEKIIWTQSRDNLDERHFNMDEAIKGSYYGGEKLAKTPSIDDIACIIYTSGTTGKPKGAMLSYKSMLSNMVSANEIFKINKKDRFIVYLPMFHSFTLTIMTLLPFYSGASIVIVGSIFPFQNVLKQTLLKRVTIFLGVPTVYNALLKAKIPWYFMWFNSIRAFISGSAPLSARTLEQFGQKFKRAKFLEGYGLSECSPAVSINRFDKQKPLSVGPALPGYEVKIVNDEMIELPKGEIGEIIVKGDCVMRGYLGKSDATDETVINGWLRTGDLGYMDEDEFIFIVDRKKDLIISKGINVYPREIEEVLAKIPNIEASAVIGKRDEEADEEIIAYVQPVEGGQIDEKEIKKFLKEHLANFKIPKKIIISPSLPRNATGKVLKRALKEL